MIKNEKVTGVTSKLDDQTRAILTQLCTDDSWTAKTLGCSVETFNSEVEIALENFTRCSDEDKTLHLDAVLEEIPKHLGTLATRKNKGVSALNRARNFIDKLAINCSGEDEATDELRFMVVTTLRILKNDILADDQSTSGKKSDEESEPRVRNFTASKQDNNTGEEKPNDKSDNRSKTVLQKLIERTKKVVGEDGKFDKSDILESSKVIYTKILNTVSLAPDINPVDDKLDSLMNMTAKEMRKFAEWIAEKIYDADRAVVDATNNGTFAEQIAKLVSIYSNRGTSNITGEDGSDDEQLTDDRRFYRCGYVDAAISELFDYMGMKYDPEAVIDEAMEMCSQ